MDQNGAFGPFRPEGVHFGPFGSANRTLAIPEYSEIMARNDFESMPSFWARWCSSLSGSLQAPAYTLFDVGGGSKKAHPL